MQKFGHWNHRIILTLQPAHTLNSCVMSISSDILLFLISPLSCFRPAKNNLQSELFITLLFLATGGQPNTRPPWAEAISKPNAQVFNHTMARVYVVSNST